MAIFCCFLSCICQNTTGKYFFFSRTRNIIKLCHESFDLLTLYCMKTVNWIDSTSKGIGRITSGEEGATEKQDLKVASLSLSTFSVPCMKIQAGPRPSPADAHEYKRNQTYHRANTLRFCILLVNLNYFGSRKLSHSFYHSLVQSSLMFCS